MWYRSGSHTKLNVGKRPSTDQGGFVRAKPNEFGRKPRNGYGNSAMSNGRRRSRKMRMSQLTDGLERERERARDGTIDKLRLMAHRFNETTNAKMLASNCLQDKIHPQNTASPSGRNTSALFVAKNKNRTIAPNTYQSSALYIHIHIRRSSQHTYGAP